MGLWDSGSGKEGGREKERRELVYSGGRAVKLLTRKAGLFLLVMTSLLVAAVLNVRILYLFQEGNPLPVLWGIMRLEFTGAEIVPFAGNKLIQKAGPEAPLTEYLAARGWIFQDRLGAGIFYKKGGAELFVGTRMFTRRYVVYELGRPLASLGAP